MPYGFIIVFAGIGLAIYYVFQTKASWLSKALVIGVLGFCLVSRCWLHRFSMGTLFLMLGLGIYVSFYRLYIQARSSNRRD
jgi:hypothetical protein